MAKKNRAWALALVSGYEILGSILLGWWMGSLIDDYWGVRPWGTALGIIFLFSLALFSSLRRLKRVFDEENP